MPSKSTRKRSIATDDVAVVARDPAQAGDTAPVSAPVAGTPALPPTVPDKAATRGVWAALVAQPGSTAASLADAAGISRPTAAKTLGLLEKAGLVTRTEGGRDGSKRLPDQWQPVARTEDTGASDRESTDDTAAAVAPPVPEAEQAGTVEEKGEPAQRRKARSSARTGKPATAPKTDAGTSRLGSGQPRDMVLQYLRDHGGEDFSPSAMGKALARSSGAISNICGSSESTDVPAPGEAAIADVLASLDEEGLVTRKGATSDSAMTWRIASAPSEGSTPAAETTNPAAAPRQRLRPGELRARVLEFVHARPRAELSPTTVARALNASAGAVNNALERLVETGEVVRKADSPRRFSAAPKRR